MMIQRRRRFLFSENRTNEVSHEEKSIQIDFLANKTKLTILYIRIAALVHEQ